MFDKSGFIEYTELFTLMKIRITAIRKASYPDLMAKYENPIEHTCDVMGWLFWSMIPVSIIAALATFAAVQEGHYIRAKRVF